MIQKYWPLLAWIVYLILPYDIFPDFFLGPGWMDDLILLGLAYYFSRKGVFGSKEATGQNQGTGTQDGPSGRRAGNRTADERTAKNTFKNPYKILGINPGADLQTIKKAYHHMAAKYHPDKVSHLGEEFQQLAKEKFQEIQWAYETLMRAHQERRA